MVTARFGIGRLLLCILALGLGAAGCSSGSSSPPPTATSSSVASPSTFGQAHHFRDGLTVTLETPSVYQRPQADSPSPEALLKIHATVLNGTPAPYAMTGPSTLELVATVNGQPAVQQSIDQPPAVVRPAGTLLPGQTQSFDTIYGLPPQVGDLVVTVTNRVSPPEIVLYRGSTPEVPAPATSTPAPAATPPTDTPSTAAATTSKHLNSGVKCRLWYSRRIDSNSLPAPPALCVL